MAEAAAGAMVPLAPLAPPALVEAVGGLPGVLSVVVEKGELVAHARADAIVEVLTMLRDDPRCRFEQMMDLCGVDWPDRTPRFQVVYNLLSVSLNQRVRVIVEAAEGEPVPSICGIWQVATWWEREAWDLFGIPFRNQPDLRRILTDYGFEGHPMRKDFPLTGYVEVRYDEDRKQGRLRQGQADPGFSQLRLPVAVGGDHLAARRREGACRTDGRAGPAGGQVMSQAEIAQTQNAPPQTIMSELGGNVVAPQTKIVEIDSHAINFGPQHPAAHGVLRLILEMDGEVVDRADPHIGLLHRGTEKLIEYKTYLQALPYFRPARLREPMSQEHAFAMATEKLLGIEIPERAKWIRTLFSEITRVLNHLLNITTYALDVGAITPSLWGFEEREKLMEFYERVSGARLHANYFRHGGVHSDMPAGLAEDIAAWAAAFPKFIDDLEDLLTGNRIWKQRTVDIGVMSAEEALAWGFSGPCLRASGVPWDLRRLAAVRDVRPGEVRHTGRPQRRLLRSLPGPHGRDAREREDRRAMSGADEARPVKIEDHKFSPPRRGDMKRSMEALIHHFKLFTEGFHVPAGSTYTVVETPKASSACTWWPTVRTGRIAARSARPGFAHLQAIEYMSKRHMLADAVAIIGSLDIVFGEIDR